MEATESIRRPIITPNDSQVIDKALEELDRISRERRERTLREIDRELDEAARLERSARYEVEAVQRRMRKLLARRAAFAMIDAQCRAVQS